MRAVVPAYRIVGALRRIPGNSSSDETVPETDTGGLVEHTEALERTMPKELGKLLA